MAAFSVDKAECVAILTAVATLNVMAIDIGPQTSRTQIGKEDNIAEHAAQKVHLIQPSFIKRGSFSQFLGVQPYIKVNL